MGTKGWVIFASIAVVILGGLIYLSNQNRIDVSEFDPNTVIGANEKNGDIGDHVFGNRNSKVVLIEYGDFQCPGCASAHPRIKELKERYSDDLAFVFRNLPLTSIHPNARVAAAAAEAAGLQGKYWEMHDKLFSSQNEWSGASVADRSGIFRGYAAALSLDLEKFDADISSSVINQKISFDQALFRTTGFQQSTPAFVLDGEQVSQDVWSSDEALDNFIREKLIAAGVELSDDTEESDSEE